VAEVAVGERQRSARLAGWGAVRLCGCRDAAVRRCYGLMVIVTVPVVE